MSRDYKAAAAAAVPSRSEGGGGQALTRSAHSTTALRRPIYRLGPRGRQRRRRTCQRQSDGSACLHWSPSPPGAGGQTNKQRQVTLKLEKKSLVAIPASHCATPLLSTLLTNPDSSHLCNNFMQRERKHGGHVVWHLWLVPR